MHPDQSPHASLSGLFPEKTATPPAEGNASAIRTAQALLGGRLPLADSLGLAIPYEPQHSLPALDWLFESEAMLADYSRPECRYLVAPPGALTEDEEGLVSGRVLDRRRRDLALRTLNDSATAALKTLVELAETGQALAPRLRARLCAAGRQELAAIVAEFSSLERATEVR